MLLSLRLLLAAAALAAWGCAPAGIPGPSRGAGEDDCVALFRYYDLMDKSISEARRDRWAVPPELMWQAQRLRRTGCITMTRDLTDLEGLPATQAGAGGPAIAPIALHAGVVTNGEDDARVLAFFAGHGVRARSVGSAALGRRVYLGPFASEGALTSAADLARSAGFVAPYSVWF